MKWVYYRDKDGGKDREMQKARDSNCNINQELIY